MSIVVLPKKNQHVAVLQMKSTDDLQTNVNAVMARLEQLEKLNPDVVCLPENCLFLRVDREKQKPTAMSLEDSYWQDFSNWAKRTNTHLLFGSVPLAGEGAGQLGAKLKNSTVYISCDGARRSVYEKIHLFDVDVAGAPRSRESDNYDHGEKPAIINIDGWKWGLSICYDVRFSELYQKYASEGAHVIAVPAAFLVPTGKAHWHVLLRARAIECQAFVVAAAQSGGHVSAHSSAKRDTFGHSLMIGPWGEILAECTEAGEGVISFVLEPSSLEKTRTQIPMASHRRRLDSPTGKR